MASTTRSLRRTESLSRIPFPAQMRSSSLTRTAKSHPENATPSRVRVNSSPSKKPPSLEQIRERLPLKNKSSGPLKNTPARHPLLQKNKSAISLPVCPPSPRPPLRHLPSVKLPTDAFPLDDDMQLMHPEGPESCLVFTILPDEDSAPDLQLDIISDEVEKWELPKRNIYLAWRGTGWTLQLAVSYVPTADQLLEEKSQPSLNITSMEAACSLVHGPRPSVATACLSPRRPAEQYSVAHSGHITSYDAEGNLRPMDPVAGIYRDQRIHGPHAVKDTTPAGKLETRLGYYTFIYIPIPLSVFGRTDTRGFDIRVTVWVSVGDRPPVPLQKRVRTTFSHFGHVHQSDDSMKCALMN